MNPQSHEPRSITIIRHVQEYLLSTATSREAFADEVKTAYHDLVPDPKARVMQFHEGGEVVRDMKANDQLVARILDRTVKFPDDMEEAFVYALPEPWQESLLKDLAGRYGLLAVRIPDATKGAATKKLSKTLTEVSEMIDSLGPIVEDGKVDGNDRKHAGRALREINDVMAELEGWRSSLSALLEDHGDG